MINDYVALDLETTGLEPKNDKIIEVGAVRVRNGKIVNRYQTLIQPGREISSRIEELTGISQNDVEAAPFVEDKIKDILKFIGEDILLGHSVLFDYSFLKRVAVNQRMQFEKKAVDTLHLSRIYLADLPSRNLHQLCLHFQIEHKEHRALEDAIATHELYQKLLQTFYKEKEEKNFTPHSLCYKVKREGPATNAQKERLYRMREVHKINTEISIERLTKNEASRLIDQMIAQYGRDLPALSIAPGVELLRNEE
ncbi:MAG TPA: 3'-5' exonuclease [Lachnospiraceae bacterium]|nr:3'-5' exonuclease [Lachnospiraceae bacterium]